MRRELFTTMSLGLIAAVIKDEASPACLMQAFVFEESPQGHDYWMRRHDEAEKGKALSFTAKRHLQRMLNYARKNNLGG